MFLFVVPTTRIILLLLICTAKYYEYKYVLLWIPEPQSPRLYLLDVIIPPVPMSTADKFSSIIL